MYQRRGEEIRLQDLTRVTATYRFPNPRTGLLGLLGLDNYLLCIHVYAYIINTREHFLQFVTFLLPLLMFATHARVVHLICRHPSASRLSPSDTRRTPVGFAGLDNA